jgi:hypothetical protein
MDLMHMWVNEWMYFELKLQIWCKYIKQFSIQASSEIRISKTSFGRIQEFCFGFQMQKQ